MSEISHSNFIIFNFSIISIILKIGDTWNKLYCICSTPYNYNYLWYFLHMECYFCMSVWCKQKKEGGGGSEQNTFDPYSVKNTMALRNITCSSSVTLNRFQAKDCDKRKCSALMICACFIDKQSKKDGTRVYTSKLS